MTDVEAMKKKLIREHGFTVEEILHGEILQGPGPAPWWASLLRWIPCVRRRWF